MYQPTKAALIAALAHPDGWDIIFFSGHSDTDEQNVGEIEINATEKLTMDDLKEVLEPAIERRIQIFIFNSCNALGVTPVLENLNIDRLIVMREPIPDAVAHQFLKNFLQAFTEGKRFDDAVKFARQQLVKLEDDHPYASWLPIAIQNRLVSSPTWQSLGKIRSPYKGLEAFTAADRQFFYGRDEIVASLHQEVKHRPLVPIIGASGCGKSSLVRAGLIPALTDCQDIWQIIELRPGCKAFDALAKALLKDRFSQLQVNPAQQREVEISLELELQADRSHLTTQLVAFPQQQQRVLLFIDQFEELLTQTEDKTTCTDFLNILADAVDRAPNFTLVFTLRSDFLFTLQNSCQDSDFGKLLERYPPQLVGGMSREMLQLVIEQPARQVGVKFQGGLVDRLLHDLENTNCNGSLPLLQFILHRLWQEQEPRLITHQGYDRICGKGRLNDALARHAEEIYAKFLRAKKDRQFKQVLLQLVKVSPTDSSVARRLATRGAIGDVNWQEVITPLADDRLVITDRDRDGVETVEIIHEAITLHWQRLQGWIMEYRDELASYAEIEAAAQKWENNGMSKHELLEGQKLIRAWKLQKNKHLTLHFSILDRKFIRVSTRNNYLSWGMFITGALLLIASFLCFQITFRALDMSHTAELKNANLENANLSGINLENAR